MAIVSVESIVPRANLESASVDPRWNIESTKSLLQAKADEHQLVFSVLVEDDAKWAMISAVSGLKNLESMLIQSLVKVAPEVTKAMQSIG